VGFGITCAGLLASANGAGSCFPLTLIEERLPSYMIRLDLNESYYYYYYYYLLTAIGLMPGGSVYKISRMIQIIELTAPRTK
jgi:hypothetical protein